MTILIWFSVWIAKSSSILACLSILNSVLFSILKASVFTTNCLKSRKIARGRYVGFLNVNYVFVILKTLVDLGLMARFRSDSLPKIGMCSGLDILMISKAFFAIILNLWKPISFRR